MRTLDLKEAATFLKMHPEEVRRRTRAGAIPGAKLGKRWVFISDDLAAFIRSLYVIQTKHLRLLPVPELTLCHSTSAEKLGGLTSLRHQESALDTLLKQPTEPRRKSYTTS